MTCGGLPLRGPFGCRAWCSRLPACRRRSAAIPAWSRRPVSTAARASSGGSSRAMPDGRSGYGFPVGGVAAFDPEEGVVSPGGVGYDINCGVRRLASDIDYREVAGRVGDLTARLAGDVPGGVGSARKDLRL